MVQLSDMLHLVRIEVFPMTILWGRGARTIEARRSRKQNPLS